MIVLEAFEVRRIGSISSVEVTLRDVSCVVGVFDVVSVSAGLSVVAMVFRSLASMIERLSRLYAVHRVFRYDRQDNDRESQSIMVKRMRCELKNLHDAWGRFNLANAECVWRNVSL